jgi:glutamyl-Q tRNA(Asp) synthetase
MAAEAAQTVGRLAPTPSGTLHLGNALAFGAAWLSARAAGGRLLLRVEDIDRQRSRPALEREIRRDLAWLGLTWDAETPPQRARDYTPALRALAPWTYRCTCTRRELAAAGGVYPGTCRDAGHPEGAIRLRLEEGAACVHDRVHGVVRTDPARAHGDPVLVRRDGEVAYTLAVVADDVRDGVTEVVRGGDLLTHSAVQEVLWRRLSPPASPRTPTWLHTPLLRDPAGHKLGKSHGSLAIAALREAGWAADDVWAVVLPWLGLPARTLAEGLSMWPAPGEDGTLPLAREDVTVPAALARPGRPPAPLPRPGGGST